MHRISAGMLAAAALTLTMPAVPVLAADEVNLYSSRKEELIKPLLDRFSEQTGIQVNLVTGKANALIQRLESEGANSPADLLVTVDAGNLAHAKEAGVTQPFLTEPLKQAIPENLRDPQGHWVGLTMRARPIFYVKDKVNPKILSTYEALADPLLGKRICIRSSNNIYNQSLVASLIAANGEQATETWAKGLVANMARPPKGGDRDQIKAAAAGECDIAIANTYYVVGMLASGDQAQIDAAGKMAVFWPNQNGRGAHVNISGAAVTAHAKHKDAAVKLMEFMVSPEAQEWYAEKNGEYPVVEGVKSGETLQQWGKFKADGLNLSKLGELNKDAVKLMDRAGWK